MGDCALRKPAEMPVEEEQSTKGKRLLWVWDISGAMKKCANTIMCMAYMYIHTSLWTIAVLGRGSG